VSRRFAWRDGGRVREVTLDAAPDGQWRATVDGAEVAVKVEPLAGGRLRLVTADGKVAFAEITASGMRRFVRLERMDFVLEATAARGRRRTGGGSLEAPMPGVVTRVMVAEGDAVKQGQPLVALEAMKMEHVIRAPHDGRVTRVAARAGEMVQGGVALVEVEPPGPA
jgi:biotin carboxyl carrier protein